MSAMIMPKQTYEMFRDLPKREAYPSRQTHRKAVRDYIKRYARQAGEAKA